MDRSPEYLSDCPVFAGRAAGSYHTEWSWQAGGRLRRAMRACGKRYRLRRQPMHLIGPATAGAGQSDRYSGILSIPIRGAICYPLSMACRGLPWHGEEGRAAPFSAALRLVRRP